MSLAHMISAAIFVCLSPAVVYVLWRLVDAVIDLVPPLRDWRDFRGLDLSPRRPRRLTASIQRVRQLPTPARVIGRTDVYDLTARARQPLALPAGTSPAADQKAQVA